MIPHKQIRARGAVLLVFTINYVEEAEEALNQLNRGVSDSLTRYSEKQINPYVILSRK